MQFLQPLFLRTNLGERGQWDKLQPPSLQLDLQPNLVLILSLFYSLFKTSLILSDHLSGS